MKGAWKQTICWPYRREQFSQAGQKIFLLKPVWAVVILRTKTRR
jgi:hypothetical protein